ncbi:MAG TPA: hypothetical protein VM577_14450 [Anaerovoracaceae bacterium]|nr:hypothetical protein [Anaerovoracaceae bacterium]
MTDTNGNVNCITYGQMNLINTLRKFWLDLPMWRRAYLISYAANFDNLDVIGNKLYNAPTDLGNVLEVFFGESIARKIEGMIREQIVIGLEILRAERTGNTEAINENTRRLYQNVDQMAAYLAQINPNWDEQTWKDLLYNYYETTILEMVTVLTGKYEEAVTLYESMENQALNIADYMAKGIIPYFTG